MIAAEFHDGARAVVAVLETLFADASVLTTGEIAGHAGMGRDVARRVVRQLQLYGWADAKVLAGGTERWSLGLPFLEFCALAGAKAGGAHCEVPALPSAAITEHDGARSACEILAALVQHPEAGRAWVRGSEIARVVGVARTTPLGPLRQFAAAGWVAFRWAPDPMGSARALFTPGPRLGELAALWLVRARQRRSELDAQIARFVTPSPNPESAR